jgi:hypothetical protein
MGVVLGRIRQGTRFTVSAAVEEQHPEPVLISVAWRPATPLRPFSYQMRLEPGQAGAHTQDCPPASEYCGIDILVELTKHETPAGVPRKVMLTVSGLEEPTPHQRVSITSNAHYRVEIVSR